MLQSIDLAMQINGAWGGLTCFRERKSDKLVNGSSLKKKADCSPIYPDSNQRIPKFTPWRQKTP
ncbi:hypothetical protein [Ktedonospora formicarum]|uniref:hypothetical protein n=1 Tax=Ktedonospora formicarum TaxID=2778364 RepID=UPI001C693BE4|nr:hypothetical protein [Ktedonospora formicarum]